MKVITIRQIGLLFLLIGVSTNLFFLLFAHHNYIKFFESTFAKDGVISRPTYEIIRIQFVFIYSFIFWMIITANKVDISIVRLSIIDKLSCLLILFLFICYYTNVFFPKFSVFTPLYGEDNFFESITVVFALTSSILLAISINYNDYLGIKLIKILLLFLFFFFGMEEISWGQRLFAFETPFYLGKFNYQKESNFHNLLNPYFNIIYPVFNLLLGLFLINLIKLRKKFVQVSIMKKIEHIMPYRESVYCGLVFLILSIQSFFNGGELTEEVFSAFCLTYSVNQFFIAKVTQNKNKNGYI